MQIVSLDAELSLDKLFVAVEVSQKNPLLKTHRSRRNALLAMEGHHSCQSHHMGY